MYKNLFPNDHMQAPDAQNIAQCHLKEKNVIADFKQQTITLDKNYKLWYNEYNVI